MPIDPQMEKVVNYLVENQGKIAMGTFGADQRPWMNFKEIKEVGQFDDLTEIFSRQKSNDEYAKAREEGATRSKDIQTTKISADFLASMERDYRMRRRSRVRMLIHAGNRSAANGLTSGPLRRNTVDWISRIEAEEDRRE